MIPLSLRISDSLLHWLLNLFILPSSGEVLLADDSLAKAEGECVVDFTLNGRYYTGLVLTVMKELCTDVILGRDFMRKHESVKFTFEGKEPEINVSVCASTTASSTTTNTMNIPPLSLFEHLSPECKPIAIKSKRQSEANSKFIKSEVQKLLSQGKIRPSKSPWRAQPIVVPGDDTHRRRMVIDYSRTINRFTELDAYPLPRIEDMIRKISQYKYFSTYDLKSAYHQIPINEKDMQYTAFEADGGLWEFTVVPFGVTNGVPSFQRTMDTVIEKEKIDDTFPFLDNITVCGNTKEELEANDKKFKEAVKNYNIELNNSKTAAEGQTTISIMGYIVSHGEMKPDPERLRPLMELAPPQDEQSQKRVMGMFAHYSKWIGNFSSKIRPLSNNKTFPLPSNVMEAFKVLKEDLKSAALRPIDSSKPLVVETDASDHSIAASLNQDGRPIAFFSRMLNASEHNHPAVEKEAYAIVEALKNWKHFLLGRQFALITDQRSVSFMFDNKRHGKIKNDKIARWRVELSDYKYDIMYRPGEENRCADTLSRNFKPTTTAASCAALLHFSHETTSASATLHNNRLKQIHDALCHPGVTRFNHFVKSRNLPNSIADVKQITESCSDCCELKPAFLKTSGTLINATQPFQRLNVDFKGPLPSSTQYKYLFTVVDEYSRFPFAFPCKDMTSSTVVQCFSQLFSIFGMPNYVHSDRAPDLISGEIKNYLNSHGIATSRTSRYNPKGNGQCERYNGIIWKTILLGLRTKKLPTAAWQQVLPDALHSIRTLLCTATNCTPHERMFHHPRRSATGNSLPTWLMNPGPVYVRKQARKSKYDPLVEKVQLIHANPEYAFIRFDNGRESTVSLRDLAPVSTNDTCDQDPLDSETGDEQRTTNGQSEDEQRTTNGQSEDFVIPNEMAEYRDNELSIQTETGDVSEQKEDSSNAEIRRSDRSRRPPRRYDEEY